MSEFHTRTLGTRVRRRSGDGGVGGRSASRVSLLVLAGLTVLAGLAAPAGAAAQLPALPHAPDPFRTNALVGPDNEARLVVGATAFGDDSGIRGPWALALRRRIRDGVTLHAGAGTYRGSDAEGRRGTRAQLGGAVDVLLVRARATLSAHGGLGYMAAADGRVVSVPIGLGASVEVARAARLVPSFESIGGPAVYLWTLPRLELLTRSRADESATEVVGGASVGLGLSSSEGVGILVALDGRAGVDDDDLPSVPRWSWGLSLRYRF